MGAPWEVIVGVAAGLSTIIGTTIYFAKATKKLAKGINDVQEGVKCMLRASMLAIYYRHNGEDKMRQYEAENFELQYAAYKTLGGNSFIDNIHEEVKKWEVTR